MPSWLANGVRSISRTGGAHDYRLPRPLHHLPPPARGMAQRADRGAQGRQAASTAPEDVLAAAFFTAGFLPLVLTAAVEGPFFAAGCFAFGLPAALFPAAAFLAEAVLAMPVSRPVAGGCRGLFPKFQWLRQSGRRICRFRKKQRRRDARRQSALLIVAAADRVNVRTGLALPARPVWQGGGSRLSRSR